MRMSLSTSRLVGWLVARCTHHVPWVKGKALGYCHNDSAWIQVHFGTHRALRVCRVKVRTQVSVDPLLQDASSMVQDKERKGDVRPRLCRSRTENQHRGVGCSAVPSYPMPGGPRAKPSWRCSEYAASQLFLLPPLRLLLLTHCSSSSCPSPSSLSSTACELTL